MGKERFADSLDRARHTHMNTTLSEEGIERLEKVMSHVIVCLEELQKDAYLDRPQEE